MYLFAHQSDNTLYLHFDKDGLPNTYYVNRMLHRQLSDEYNDDMKAFLQDFHNPESSSWAIPFDVDDELITKGEVYCALTEILEEYQFSIKTARIILRWILDNYPDLEQSQEVMLQILEQVS